MLLDIHNFHFKFFIDFVLRHLSGTHSRRGLILLHLSLLIIILFLVKKLFVI